jgi:alkanesulfonate monooxygenase SsuD/methylene tetrahydromethanopterin reductase-like flavin-dependent oxidoreductase (luciferase family)
MLRQLYLRIADARGHSQIIGTPAQIVAEMEERFRAGGADSFNIMPPTLPGRIDNSLNSCCQSCADAAWCGKTTRHDAARPSWLAPPRVSRR